MLGDQASAASEDLRHGHRRCPDGDAHHSLRSDHHHKYNTLEIFALGLMMAAVDEQWCLVMLVTFWRPSEHSELVRHHHRSVATTIARSPPPSLGRHHHYHRKTRTRNMLPISTTLPTSHEPTSWLKAVAL